MADWHAWGFDIEEDLSLKDVQLNILAFLCRKVQFTIPELEQHEQWNETKTSIVITDICQHHFLTLQVQCSSWLVVYAK